MAEFNIGDTHQSIMFPTYTKPEPYVWDGHSRPNVNDYTAPWAKTASKSTYKYAWTKSRREHNQAVTYAKNQLQAALAQYDADLSYWQEQDERRYTSQASQAQRYEDAGFNMGYVYGSVDNGNSAVGYNPSSSDFNPADNEVDDIGGVKLIVDCVTNALSLVTPLIQSGISLKKLPHEIEQIKAGTSNLKAQAGLAEVHTQLQSFLQSHDMNGDPVDSLGDSLAFAMQEVQYFMTNNQSNLAFEQVRDMQEWNLVAKEIYELQKTPTASEAFNKWINSLDMPDWCKAVCIVLGGVVGVGGQGLAGKSKVSKKTNKNLKLPSK